MKTVFSIPAKAIGVLSVLGISAMIALPAAPAAPASNLPDAPAFVAPVIRKAPTWQPELGTVVRAEAMGWIMQTNPDLAPQAASVWEGVSNTASGGELLDRLAHTFALSDPRAAALVELCSHPRTRVVLPNLTWLKDPSTAPLEAGNLRLYFARWLVEGQWFEEALEEIDGMPTSDVAAPAELLFFQGVCYHRLIDKENKEKGLKVIGSLLDGADACPRRYVAVAGLIQSDLNTFEAETLDHIARRMEDIHRRLELGRTGPKVKKVEDDVIASLDKMIKKIEEDQDKQQQQQNQANNTRSSRPAQDSTPAGGKGPMEVAKKHFKDEGGWGTLPPKEREILLDSVGREFPPHYRDIIEQYYRQIATEGSDNNEPRK